MARLFMAYFGHLKTSIKTRGYKSLIIKGKNDR
jgi:hypothetical protein